jgi:hypothetical protein
VRTLPGFRQPTHQTTDYQRTPRGCAKNSGTHRRQDATDAELRRRIREGFEQGIPGERLAEAAGLSIGRVYQIRDGRR